MSFDLLQQDPFVAPGAEQADAAKVLTAGNLGTDLDAALRFAERCGDVLRFAAGVGWLWWDGARWRPDAEGKARHLAMEAARAWTRACATYNGPDRNARVREAMTLEGASHIRNSVSLAENLPSLAVSHAALDRDPWLLNCRNGTLDLRTAELRPHRREDLITKLAPVNYHVGAAHGVFDRYLATISATAPDMPDFLARCFGAALTGDVSVVLHGRWIARWTPCSVCPGRCFEIFPAGGLVARIVKEPNVRLEFGHRAGFCRFPRLNITPERAGSPRPAGKIACSLPTAFPSN